MIPASVTAPTPDARSLPGRSSDGSQQDDGFDATLAGLEQNGTADVTSNDTAARAQLVGSAKGGAAKGQPPLATGTTTQGIASLLAKLANGGAEPPVGVSGATLITGDAGKTASGGTPGKAKPETADVDAAPAAPIAADPLSSMAALLPGMVTPTPAASGGSAVIAQTESAKLSLALGAASTSRTADGPRGQSAASSTEGASTDSAEPDVILTSAASSTHLAPVSTGPSAAFAMPRAVGTSTVATGGSTPDGAGAGKGVSASSIGGSSVAASSISAAAGPGSHDAAPTDAVTTRAEPDAKLTTGTLQAIAGAVTSLAADTPSAGASASSPAARPATNDPTSTTPTPMSPARSLTLQLTPGDLGSVTVRLHLTAGGLDVNLAVDDSKTLASISHARDELAAAIGDNGYRVESLVIRGSDASSTSTAGSNDSARSQSEAGAGQGSSSGGGSGSSGGDASSSRQRAPQSSSRPGDTGRDRGADGIFV